MPACQAWFFTPEWLAGEREADAELRDGRGIVHGSAEEMFRYLDALGEGSGLEEVQGLAGSGYAVFGVEGGGEVSGAGGSGGGDEVA